MMIKDLIPAIRALCGSGGPIDRVGADLMLAPRQRLT